VLAASVCGPVQIEISA